MLTQSSAKGDLSEHFSRKEFKCHCSFSACPAKHPVVDIELIRVLEDLREHFGKPIFIKSGTRCLEHNEAIRGAPKSKHLLGIAADIWIKGVKLKKVHNYLLQKYPNKYGIAKNSASRFIHIDVRREQARWTY